MFPRTAPLVLLVSLLAACSSTSSQVPSTPQPVDAASHSPWLQPTPELRRKIEERMARMEYLNNLEQQVEMIQWFVAQNELAYPALIELAGGPDDRSAGLALAALGSSRDGRLVEHLQGLPMPGPERPNVRLERARCHMNLGDWSHADILLEGLRSDDLRTRGQSAAALRRATQQNFGFRPQAEPEEREAAVEAWEAWLAAYRADPLR